jgi:hypothetical protein
MVLTSQPRNIRPKVRDQLFNGHKGIPIFLVALMPMVALTPFIVVTHQAMTGITVVKPILEPMPSFVIGFR